MSKLCLFSKISWKIKTRNLIFAKFWLSFRLICPSKCYRCGLKLPGVHRLGSFQVQTKVIFLDPLSELYQQDKFAEMRNQLSRRWEKNGSKYIHIGPKHGSSDGRAGDSRSKGPGFNPCLDPMRMTVILQWKFSPKSRAALELHSRVVLSVEAHHRVNGPNIGKNSGGRRIIKREYPFGTWFINAKKLGLDFPIKNYIKQ